MKNNNSQQPRETGPQIEASFLLTKVDHSTSVRSTFTLTPVANAILNALSREANITQREVFDQAVENGWLTTIAEEIKKSPIIEEQKTRKTLVLSDRALAELNKVSNTLQVKRDDLACKVCSRMLESYNSQVRAAQEKWKVIDSEIKEALLAAIDYRAAEEHLNSANIPEEHLDNVKAAISTMLDLICYVIEDEAQDDYLGLNSHIRGALADLRTIAENLEPIEITDLDLRSLEEMIADLQNMEDL